MSGQFVRDLPFPSGSLQGRLCSLAHWVAQVCNADARDHRRVAKDGWRAGEVVEESNSGAKKHRRDVDVDLVEETRIQALLDGVGALEALAVLTAVICLTKVSKCRRRRFRRSGVSTAR